MKPPVEYFIRAVWMPEKQHYAWDVRCPACETHCGTYAWRQRKEAVGAAERHQCPAATETEPSTVVPGRWD